MRSATQLLLVDDIVYSPNKYSIISSVFNKYLETEGNKGVVGKPYCASITMYPFLLHGMRPLGGAATAPHNLKSFLGSFVNLAFAAAAQLAGAVSTPEFLPYMDYFIRKEYGDDYYEHTNTVVDLSTHKRTIDKIITDGFEQVVYCLNEPAGA